MFPTRRICLALLVAPCLALGACEQNPVTGRSQLILIPEDQASEMGVQAFQQILSESQPGTSAQQQRVERIGRRVLQAAGSDTGGQNWTFSVIKDETPNAFALPGGKVGMHTGMLDAVENDAQLAAVIAHEIAHVTARHSAERMSREALTQAGVGLAGATLDSQAGAQLLAQAAQLGVILPFSRGQESEADRIGLAYMARAGYDPRQAVRLWQNFAAKGGQQPPQFLSTHPHSAERAKELQAQVDELMPVYRQNARD
ncbi:MAG: M48 family metallopeptidase [Rhodospirillaceae bacterium]